MVIMGRCIGRMRRKIILGWRSIAWQRGGMRGQVILVRGLIAWQLGRRGQVILVRGIVAWQWG